jgi:hypothetical protein
MAIHRSISPEEAADRLALRELVDAHAHCADRRDAKKAKWLYSPKPKILRQPACRRDEPHQPCIRSLGSGSPCKMNATQETNAVESLQEWICELLIKNQQLRMALVELKARERMDFVGRNA